MSGAAGRGAASTSASGFSGIDNVRLYQVLGLPRTDASVEDIKRAYRRMSLKHHPDRNLDDPDSTAKFQAVSKAYGVLSNPKLRSIYDSYGEQGLSMYESYVNFAESSAEDGGPAMLPMSPATLMGLVCGVIGFLVILFTAFSVDLFLKLEHDASAPLSLLFIPLWILDSIALLALYIFLFNSARKGQYRSDGSRSAALSLLVVLCYIAFQVLLALRVDGDTPTLSYAIVFVPLYVTELIAAAKAAARCRRSTHDAERVAGSAHPNYALHMLLTLGWPLARIATLVLAVLNLEKVTSLNWAIVFTPILAYVACYVCFGCQQLRAPASTEREQMLQVGQRVTLFFALFGTLLLVLLVLILTGAIGSWLALFIFPFILSGCFFCCCCCACMCIRLLPKSGPVEVPPGDGMREPADTPAFSTERSGRSDGSKSPPEGREDAPLLSGKGGSYAHGPSPPDDLV